MALKASPEDQALLLDLQALDTKLTQLAHRGKSLPQHAVVADLTAQADAVRLVFLEQSGALEDVRIELRRIESDVEIVETRITRDTARLQTSSSVKDVAALEQELAALAKRLGDLEEIQLAVMERTEEQEAAIAATTAQLDELNSRKTAIEGERDAELARLDSEATHTAANRRTIAGKVPEDLLALYEKQRSRYGTGASLLQGGVSLASGVKLLENDLQTIRRAAPDDVLLCPASDAILVRTNESGL